MAAPYPQLVLFGDSLFQQSVNLLDGFSFQAELQSKCIRKLDVVNRGFSGWNSANALGFLPEIFPPATGSGPKIEYFLVLLGANDAVLPLPSTSQHVPMATYKENLKAIVTHPHITDHNGKVLLVTPPPVDEVEGGRRDAAYGHGRAIREARVSAAYAQAAREVAREVPVVVLVDLWQTIMDAAVSAATPGRTVAKGELALGTAETGRGGLRDLLHDGLHMSGKAYRLFCDLVIGHIDDKWKNDDRAGYVFPDWNVLNPLPSGGG